MYNVQLTCLVLVRQQFHSFLGLYFTSLSTQLTDDFLELDLHQNLAPDTSYDRSFVEEYLSSTPCIAIALVTVNGEDRPIEKFGSVSKINSQTTSSKCFEYSPQLGSESPKKFLRGPRDQERKTQRCGICVQNPDLHFALSTEKLSLLALPLFTSPCCSIRLLGDVRHLVSRSWCGRSRGF